MAQRTYSLLSISLVSFLYAFILSLVSQKFYGIAEPFGAAFGLLIASTIVATVVGLVSGVAKKGAFSPGFFWAFITATPLCVIAFHFGVLNSHFLYGLPFLTMLSLIIYLTE